MKDFQVQLVINIVPETPLAVSRSPRAGKHDMPNRIIANAKRQAGRCGFVCVSRFAIILFATLLVAQPLYAEDKSPTITRVQLGFKSLPENAKTPTHKVGHWAPLTVEVRAGIDGLPAGSVLVVEAEDSEDHATLRRLPVQLASMESSIVRTLVRPGRIHSDIRVWLEAADGTKTQAPPFRQTCAGLNSYLYLTLGSKLDDLPDALEFKENKAKSDGTLAGELNRFAAFENDPSFLPGDSSAYDTADLIVLNSEEPKFLDAMLKSAAGPALTAWVVRGGRLVVPVQPNTLTKVLAILERNRPDKDIASPPTILAKSLVPIEAWAGLQSKPFPARGEPSVPIVRLDPKTFGVPTWDVMASLEDKATGERPLPLIARMPLGFGSITLIAFPLDASSAFARWSGRVEFLRTLVDQVGPRYQLLEKTKEQSYQTGSPITDWGTQIHRDLDLFDVPMIPFGYVALFILLYVLLVSGIDYFLLRRFYRLDGTWFTFPAIVLGVSLAAYAALRTGQDHDLLINKIDLVDIDLRAVDEEPRIAGSTFFAVRSPKIQTLDVQLRANASPFGPNFQGRVDSLEWFGRPDAGPAGMGRGASQSLSRKTYDLKTGDDDARRQPELSHVPFPYRGVKSFEAAWHLEPTKTTHPAGTPPLIDLVYHPREFHLKVSGTITNPLAFDLDDVSLFVFDRVYPLEGGLKKGETRKIAIKEIDSGTLPTEWRDKSESDRPIISQGVYDPSPALRNLLFHERFDPQLQKHNHLFRRLDWSWRLRDDPRVVNLPLSTLGPREAILFAHAKHRRGDADAIMAEPSSPTCLTLTPPAPAVLSQDTYLRILLPLRPKE